MAEASSSKAMCIGASMFSFGRPNKASGNKTLRPLRKHKSGKSAELFKFKMDTLGSGNLAGCVAVPPGEDINDWLSVNLVDFFNELSLVTGLVQEDFGNYSQLGQGFPQGFEYRISGEKGTTPVRCTAPQYIEHVMTC